MLLLQKVTEIVTSSQLLYNNISNTATDTDDRKRDLVGCRFVCYHFGE